MPSSMFLRADLVGDAGDRVDLLVADASPRGRWTTKSPSSTARSTPTREPKRSRSAVSRSSTSSSDACDHVDLDGDALEVGQLDLGAHVGLDGELEVLAVLEGHRGDVDLGLADGADVLGLGGLGEEARQGLVDGLLHDGATADALVDDPARDLALAEARDLHLGADRAVRLVEHRLQLRERDLHDELDPGRADGLDGTLHFRHSTTMGESGTIRGVCRAGRPQRAGAFQRHASTRHTGSAPRTHASGRGRGHPIGCKPLGRPRPVGSRSLRSRPGRPTDDDRPMSLIPTRTRRLLGAGVLAAGVVATVTLGTTVAAATAALGRRPAGGSLVQRCRRLPAGRRGTPEPRPGRRRQHRGGAQALAGQRGQGLRGHRRRGTPPERLGAHPDGLPRHLGPHARRRRATPSPREDREGHEGGAIRRRLDDAQRLHREHRRRPARLGLLPQGLQRRSRHQRRGRHPRRCRCPVASTPTRASRGRTASATP